MSDAQNCTRLENPYLPKPARIIRTLPQIVDHQLFQIRFEDEEMINNFKYLPGQFVMLSVIGTGEAPFSISSSPTRPGIIELCVRRIGHVTNAFRQFLGMDRGSSEPGVAMHPRFRCGHSFL